MKPSDNGYITKQELAKYLSVSASTVLRLEKDGKLPEAWRPNQKLTLYNFQKCIEYIENGSTRTSA